MKSNVLVEITNAVGPELEKSGYVLKNTYYEKRIPNFKNLSLRYEINFSRRRGHNSLHLTLGILDKEVSSKVSSVLQNVLDHKNYPE